MPTNSNEVGTLIIEEVADDLKVTERTIYRLAGARKTFSNGSSKAGTPDTGPFAPPPVALRINSQHGAHLLALGHRKWHSQGGYQTFTHADPSLLEVPPPFIEISKTGA